MFDDLLKTRRDEFTLLEWADNGWLSEVKELDPFCIALLQYPYTKINKRNKKKRDKTNTLFMSACDLLLYEATQGDIPCCYIKPFRIPFMFDLARPGEDGDNSFAFCAWVAFRRINFPSFKLNYDIPIIPREEFKQWLIKKGKWPVSPDSLLSRWFDGCGGITDNESDGNSFRTPAKEEEAHKPFVYDLKRKDEITDVLINAIEQCRNGNDFPSFIEIWRYFTKTPSIKIGLFTIEISAEKDRITIDKRTLDKEMLRSRFNKIKDKLARD